MYDNNLLHQKEPKMLKWNPEPSVIMLHNLSIKKFLSFCETT